MESPLDNNFSFRGIFEKKIKTLGVSNSYQLISFDGAGAVCICSNKLQNYTSTIAGKPPCVKDCLSPANCTTVKFSLQWMVHVLLNAYITQLQHNAAHFTDCNFLTPTIRFRAVKGRWLALLASFAGMFRLFSGDGTKNRKIRRETAEKTAALKKPTMMVCTDTHLTIKLE